MLSTRCHHNLNSFHIILWIVSICNVCKATLMMTKKTQSFPSLVASGNLTRTAVWAGKDIAFDLTLRFLENDGVFTILISVFHGYNRS